MYIIYDVYSLYLLCLQETRPINIDESEDSFVGHEYLQLGSDIPLQNLISLITSCTDINLFDRLNLWARMLLKRRIYHIPYLPSIRVHAGYK